MRSASAARRVVVTGIGVVSPAGTGLDAFWKGLHTPPADRRERTVEDFDPSPWLSPKEARRVDRFTHFALEAVSVLLSFDHRELPPTTGTTDVHPSLDVDVVLEPRAWEPGPTIGNSFGFGGHSGSLVLGPA